MYALVSPVNGKVLLRYLGHLSGVFGILLAVPAIAGIILGDWEGSAAFAAAAALCIVGGYLLFSLLPEDRLERKEAVVLAALTFPFCALAAAIPLGIAGDLSFYDALFESVSAVTTTGLSVASAGGQGPLFLFARSYLQWVGGLAIIVLMLSVLLPPGTASHNLYAAQLGGGERIRPEVTHAARVLGSIYLLLTAGAVLLLFAAGMGPFDALCHALSSVSTGGFSTRPESIAAFSGPFIPAAVIICCVAGAMSFAIWPLTWREGGRALRDPQMIAFFLIAAAGAITLAIALHSAYTSGGLLENSVFQAFSAITTAGFSTADPSAFSHGAKFVLSGLMWCGGAVGSTAGGIKVFRILVLLAVVRIVFLRIFLPSETVIPVRVGDHVVSAEEIYAIIAYILLYFAVMVASAFLLAISGISLDNAIFEVSSALGTVGLSTGVAGPGMADVVRAVLAADMLLGRIEIIPLCILVLPQTWIKGGGHE